MAELNEHQIELISAYIRQHGVAQDELHDDLLDHVCTSIEHKMDGGQAFEQAFADTIKLFGPGGLKQVQQQTFELLTEMNETMKKVAFVFGLTSAFLLLAGTIFKLMHWPGASIMVVLGGGILSLLYLPTLLIHKLKESPRGDALQHISGFVGLGLTAVGVTFKIMHWPGAGFLLIGGMTTLGLFYVPIYFFRQYKQSSNKPVTLSAALVAMTCLILVFALTNMRTSSEMNRGLALISEELANANDRYMEIDALYERAGSSEMVSALRKNASATVALLDAYKHHLIAHTEGVSIEEAKTIRASALNQRFSYDVPTHILFRGEGEHAEFHIDRVVEAVEAFEAEVLGAYEPGLQATMGELLPFDTEKNYTIEGKQVDWATYHFYKIPLIGVISELTNLQVNVRNAEMQALLHIISQPAAADPPSGS